MKFIVSSSVLLKKLTSISGVIASNPTNPLLESFKFDISADKIKATATDNQTTMSVDIEVQGKEKAVICIEAKILLDLLKNLSEQPLTFDINLENYFIEFTSNEGKYSLSGESAQMFPKLEIPEGAKNFTLRSSQLVAAINNTLFVVPQDELRPNMSGVYFEMAKDSLTFVSTDAHRLIRYTLSDASCPEEHGVIVPKKPLNVLKGALQPSDTPIKLSYTKSHLYIAQEDLELACLLVNAKFPDYKMVLPTNNPYTLTINRAEFLSAMRRVAVFANKTTNQMIMKINGSELRLFAQDVDFAHEGNERMPCKYNGEDMDIAFNAKLFVELINTLTSEEIHIELSTPSRAGIIKPSELADGEDILMLLMPLMIN